MLRLERKIKKAALTAAIEFSSGRMNKSPERYARNLIELATSTYPGSITKEEEGVLFDQIIQLTKLQEVNKIRELMNVTFPDE